MLASLLALDRVMFGGGVRVTGDHGDVSVVTHSPSGRVQERLIAALVPDAVDHPGLVPPAPLPLLPALRRLHHRDGC